MGASCEAEAAERGEDGLVVTATRAEEVAEFAVLAAEAVGRIMVLEAAHVSDPPFDAAMVLLETVVQVGASPVADPLVLSALVPPSRPGGG